MIGRSRGVHWLDLRCPVVKASRFAQNRTSLQVLCKEGDCRLLNGKCQI